MGQVHIKVGNVEKHVFNESYGNQLCRNERNTFLVAKEKHYKIISRGSVVHYIDQDTKETRQKFRIPMGFMLRQ